MRRRHLSRVLLESALIVASILLAFALNRWWEARQDRMLAERALATFVQEISENRDNLVIAIYDRVLERLGARPRPPDPPRGPGSGGRLGAPGA
jgi:hypothetical protein